MGIPLKFFEPTFQHGLNFGNKRILDAFQVQALELDHAVTVPTGVFLNPVAHCRLTVLNLVLQALLDIGPLDFHVALHIERQAVGADKLFQFHQQRKVFALVFLQKLAQHFEMRLEKGYDGFIVYLIELQRILFLCSFIYSHGNNLCICFGILVSLFVSPEPSDIRQAAKLGADIVELCTRDYSEATSAAQARKRLQDLALSTLLAKELGLQVHAGHGLDYHNVLAVADLGGVTCMNIGFAIITRALFAGLPTAVNEMKGLL